MDNSAPRKGTLSIIGQEARVSNAAKEVVALGLPTAVVTLGCAKNEVDSEVIAGLLKASGVPVVSSLEEARAVVVNTCGFIESAVTESVDTILELLDLKANGALKKVVVAGCLVGRYGKDLNPELDGVDAFLSPDQLPDVVDLFAEEDASRGSALRRGVPFLYSDLDPRVGGGPSRYVKISEGCDRPCAFCSIPQIRGSFRSRKIDSILREVAGLADSGAREIVLIGQDLTAFGSEGEGPGIISLLEELDRVRLVPWIRLLYAYPLGLSPELLNALITLPTVLEYLDIPLQHSSERVLKSMRRPVGRFASRALVNTIKSVAPEMSVRTTFIVGHPGESEADFEDLLDFVGEGHFTHVGVFEYSEEEGTDSALLQGQVPKEERRARREQVMLAQQRVVEERNSRMVGSTLEVLVEGAHPETELLLAGRARFQAPEVDGIVVINDCVEDLDCRAGARVLVEITESAGYDLIGRAVGGAPEWVSGAVKNYS